MMTRTRLGLAAALLAPTLLAVAGPAAARVPFSRADLNHDGIVTYEEASIVMPRLKHIQYSKTDSNGDGVIDKGEYPLLDSYYGYVVSR